MKRASLHLAALAAALPLLLAGCGGGGDAATASPAQHAAGGPGDPAAGAVDKAAFIKLAQDQATCADTRNRLWLIDDKMVFWDRAGSCKDNGWSMKLFGASPQAELCSRSDSIAGPQAACANDTLRGLFDTITLSAEGPALGLDASHKVELIPFLPPAGFALRFDILDQASFSGIKEARSVVIRDQAAWDKLWREHKAGADPLPRGPWIDFSRQMAVGVFTGNNNLPCGQVGIVGIASRGDRLVVDYELRSPQLAPACPPVVTEPMQLVVVDRVDGEVQFAPHTVELLPSAELDASYTSGVQDARQVVVKDQEAWAALWAEHAGKDRPLPAVDFGKKQVVGVFLGKLTPGCGSVRVDSVSSDRHQVSVRYVYQPPPIAVMCPARSSPAQMIVIDRTDLPVVFAKDRMRQWWM